MINVKDRFQNVSVRPLSVCSMGDESFNKIKLSPMEKKLTYEFYFIFSTDMLRREQIFSRIGSFSAPKQPNFFKMSLTRKKS